MEKLEHLIVAWSSGLAMWSVMELSSAGTALVKVLHYAVPELAQFAVQEVLAPEESQ